jgi:hypothetical protein
MQIKKSKFSPSGLLTIILKSFHKKRRMKVVLGIRPWKEITGLSVWVSQGRLCQASHPQLTLKPIRLPILDEFLVLY